MPYGKCLMAFSHFDDCIIDDIGQLLGRAWHTAGEGRGEAETVWSHS